MYHQLQAIGEEGLVAEIEYRIEDEDIPVITKITVDQSTIPIGVFDLAQLERMADKLSAGHSTVMRGLIDDARIDAWEARRADMEAYA